MSETLINRLVEFAESGNQQKIILAGQNHQGWIMEITEDALLISTGFAEKTGNDVWINFSDLEHLHIHIIPRYKDQELKLDARWGMTKD